jgi:hypothetical protein
MERDYNSANNKWVDLTERKVLKFSTSGFISTDSKFLDQINFR